MMSVGFKYGIVAKYAALIKMGNAGNVHLALFTRISLYPNLK
jgi:hypothetical protein